jgi:hypothetical protein
MEQEKRLQKQKQLEDQNHQTLELQRQKLEKIDEETDAF